MARAGEQTGLVWPKLSDRTAAEIDRFLAPSLRHNVVDAEALAVHPDVNDWVEGTYSAMVELAADPASNSAQQKLDDVRGAFEKASRIFGRVFVDFEENVAVAQMAAGSLAAQLAEASTSRDGLQHAVGALTGERDHLAAQLADAAGARESLQQAVAALTGERDHLAAQLSEAAGARESLQQAVAPLTGERDHLAAQLAEAAGARDGLQQAVVALTSERDTLLAQSAAACAEQERAAREVAEERQRVEALLLERLTDCNNR
jgi:chromosome segregation ATPase